VRFFDQGERITQHWHIGESFGWYDLKITVEGDVSFEQHIAGHVETGRDSMTDPLIGA
jgi:phospholipase C